MLYGVDWHVSYVVWCRLVSVVYTLSQGELQPQWRVLQDILHDSFVCYQDLLEYVGL